MIPLVMIGSGLVALVYVIASITIHEIERLRLIQRHYDEFRAFVFRTEANLLRRRQKRAGYRDRAVRGHKTRRTGRLQADPILRSLNGA